MSIRILALSDLRTQTFGVVRELCRQVEPDLLIYGGDDVSRFGTVPDEVYVDLAIKVLRQPHGRQSLDHDDGLTTWISHVREHDGWLVTLGIDTQVRVRKSGSRWTGEIVKRREVEGSFAELAATLPLGVAGVIGNDCSTADGLIFEASHCRNLHSTPLLVGEWTIIGLAGSPDDDQLGYALYREEAAAAHLDRVLATVQTPNCLLVSHAPPFGILDTAQRFGVRSIGSKAVRERLSRFRAVICGHVHRQGGQFAEVDGCVVMNVANHDNDIMLSTNVAIIELRDNHLNYDVRSVYCKDPSDLLNINGVGGVRKAKLLTAGYRTVEEVARADPWDLEASVRGFNEALRIQARARAIVEKRVVLIEKQDSPDTFVVIDVETSTDRQDDPWLIGLHFPSDQVVQLHELDVKRHPKHLMALDTILQDWFWDHQLVQWSAFDRAALQRAWKRHNLPPPEWLEDRYWFNACSWGQCSIALPAGTFGLKSISKLFGFKWRHPGIDGMTAGLMYERYRDHGQTFDVERLREYNEDDLRATRSAVGWIETIHKTAAEPAAIYGSRRRR